MNWTINLNDFFFRRRRPKNRNLSTKLHPISKPLITRRTYSHPSIRVFPVQLTGLYYPHTFQRVCMCWPILNMFFKRLWTWELASFNLLNCFHSIKEQNQGLKTTNSLTIYVNLTTVPVQSVVVARDSNVMTLHPIWRKMKLNLSHSPERQHRSWPDSKLHHEYHLQCVYCKLTYSWTKRARLAIAFSPP